MDDVARAAGCARQSIYKHFATKDELLTALFVGPLTIACAIILALMALFGSYILLQRG